MKKKYATGGALSPDQIVADIDRRQNEEDRDLIPRAGRAIVGLTNKAISAGKKLGSSLTSQEGSDKAKLERVGLKEGSEDYKLGQKTLENNRKKLPSEMTKKSPYEMKSGGKVSSASKRADGCAIRGKTRA
jgi:hypothetical protein